MSIKHTQIASPLKAKSELPWTKTEAVIRVFFYYILILALLLFLQLSFGGIFFNTTFIQDPNSQFLFFNIIASITGIFGMGLTLLFLKFDGRKFIQLGWFIPEEYKKLIVLSFVVTIFALSIGFLFELLGGVIDLQQMFQDCYLCGTNGVEGFIQGFLEFILSSGFVIFGIALGEEIMFRGYIQRVLESHLSFWRATAISAFLFGLLHSFLLTTVVVDKLPTMIAVGVSAFIFGFVFSYAYKVTGRSLFFPILIHGIWDALIFFFDTRFQYNTTEKIFIEIFSQFSAAILFFVILYLLQKNYRPKRELEEWE